MVTFLDLPAELRNRIYYLYLVSWIPIDTSRRVQRPEPSLLRVSRTLRFETSPIFYGCNVFESWSYWALLSFIECLGPEKVNMLGAVLSFHHQPRSLGEARMCIASDNEFVLQKLGVKIPDGIHFVQMGFKNDRLGFTNGSDSTINIGEIRRKSRAIEGNRP